MWVFWFFTILIGGGILSGIFAIIADKVADIKHEQKSDREMRIRQNKFDKVTKKICAEINAKHKKERQEKLRLSKLTDREIEYEKKARYDEFVRRGKEAKELAVEDRIRAEIEEEFRLKEQKKLEDKIRARIINEYSYSN